MDLVFIIGAIVVIFLLFMAGRDIANWCFKIEKRLKAQEETNMLLRQIIQRMDKKP